MSELHTQAQLLRIVPPPLKAANAAMNRQCRQTARTESCYPLAVSVFTDPVVCSQHSKVPGLIEMLPDRAFPTDRCQAGIRVYMHGV